MVKLKTEKWLAKTLKSTMMTFQWSEGTKELCVSIFPTKRGAKELQEFPDLMID